MISGFRLSVRRKAFSVQSSHTFSSESAAFDERNLVSAAGLVPVLELAEQTGLSRLIGEHVEGIVKLSEVGAVANHISLMRHI